jgi:16S rRNA (guanine966-N2)-methyltransferase
MTRIISGKLRGKLIKAPLNLPVRPTTDFAKEGLFNILNNHFYLDEIRVLDLFAGTGNLSFELASRGTESINAVDQDRSCCNFIEKTSTELDFDKIIKVYRSEVFEFLKRDPQAYDLIIADPPFDYQDYDKLVEKIFSKDLLLEDGYLVIEHDRDHDLSELPHFQEKRKYGKVSFSFFRHEAEETE